MTEIKPNLPLKDGARGRTETGRWYTIKRIGGMVDSKKHKSSGIFARVYDDEVKQ